MNVLERWVAAASDWIWGPPLLVLVTGGGLYFLVVSRLTPFRHFGHALGVLAGKHDKPGAEGQVSHFQALSVALAATVGMGNVSGVAIAVKAGGPGVLFWMWISAIVGTATKYFTCSLAVMYRRRDDEGELIGGPMVYIVEGLGRRWYPLAVLFCVAGMFGCLPVFNANQLTTAISEIGLSREVAEGGDSVQIALGAALAVVTGIVVFGGLKRTAHVVTLLVPAMVVLYFVAVSGILLDHSSEVPGLVASIFRDAFAAEHIEAEAGLGGALGALIVLGAQRAAFSNEAGLGTAALAHGAARTNEPVHEGLVAMLGPMIDTLIVCTLTGLALLATGVWETSEAKGIALTAEAFASVYPAFGTQLLLVAIACFSLSSLFGCAFFGGRCFAFLFGARRVKLYRAFYVVSIVAGAAVSLDLVMSFIDFVFALMAIPTVLGAVLLAPRVREATERYWS